MRLFFFFFPFVLLLLPVCPGLKTAVFSGKDVGGTCVNRGCVPSKALLAASGRVREMQDDHHLDGMGIKVRMYVHLSQQRFRGVAVSESFPCCCR